jgi:hypothetical protein
MASAVVRQVRCAAPLKAVSTTACWHPTRFASERRGAAAPDMFEWRLATLPVEVDAA